MECIECGRRPEQRARGWRAYRADLEPDDEPEIIFYCAECATREFGPLRAEKLDRRGDR
jgi:hypothetical protein